jgi:YgiT-type zinc finger domain-containing protein
MKCAICKQGNTLAGTTTVVLEKNDTTLLFKKVPADVCDNCGEEYVSSEVTKELLSRASKESKRGVSLELLNFNVESTQPAYA